MRSRALATLMVCGLLVAAAPAVSAAEPPDRVYEITIHNLTEGQWFTPAAVATHRRSVDLFTVRRATTFKVKEIAENGNLDPMIGLLSTSRGVSNWAVVTSPTDPPPIGPGASVTFELTARPGARFLSWMSMLICTNDGFTGLDAVRLPQRVGTTRTFTTAGYDAGTEVNTEAWKDLVPPCAQLTGFGDQGGTGVSNPGLAEGGVIAMHPGIAGIADLVPDVHGWIDPVALVEVTRTG